MILILTEMKIEKKLSKSKCGDLTDSSAGSSENNISLESLKITFLVSFTQNFEKEEKNVKYFSGLDKCYSGC